MKRVALHYPVRPGNAQGFLRGIFRYARPAKPWELSLTFDWDVDRLLAWKPHGVIGHIVTREAAAMAERVQAPMVDTAFEFPHLNAARVGLDDRAIGAAAAEHFLDLGFTNFVYVAGEDKAYTLRRWQGFEARLRKAGHRPASVSGVLGCPWREALSPVSERACEWIRGLPRPVGIFAAYDVAALQLLEVARTAGVRVPEDVAVLGVGDVDLVCDLASPPLSSVRTATEAAGHEAARLLDRWMDGHVQADTRVELPPLGVATRRSTDIYAVADTALANALRFIRDHATRPIGVADVVKAACVSRSSLERRFRAVLHRSPLEEIYRVRIARARDLLVETDWSMTHVASESGFRDGSHLAEAFRAQMHDSPAAYRRRLRAPGSVRGVSPGL